MAQIFFPLIPDLKNVSLCNIIQKIKKCGLTIHKKVIDLNQGRGKF